MFWRKIFLFFKSCLGSDSMNNGSMPNIDELKGVYKYFWITLKNSDFVNHYFNGSNERFFNYLNAPDENAYDFVTKISDLHRKSVPTMSALNTMKIIEQSIGRLRESHRIHVVHSINVFLLGLCFVEEHPKLKQLLLFYPGEEVNPKKTHNNTENRLSIFYFRWIFCCFFHDVGYIYELMAKGLDPDGMGIAWEGFEEVRRGIGRIKVAVQNAVNNYVNELRSFPIIPFEKGFDDKKDVDYFPENGHCENGHRVIKEETDIIELFSYLIEKSNGKKLGKFHKIFEILQKTLDDSFNVGVEKSFDHGKIGAFIFLHEIRTTYLIGRKDRNRTPGISWHRANVYFDMMDAATAIYLHNSLRFQLLHVWGKYTPEKIPPLSYLLTLCDLLVEWDKPPIGYGSDTEEIRPEQITIESIVDEGIIVKYNGKKDIADGVNKKIEKMFDPDFIEIRIQH